MLPSVFQTFIEVSDQAVYDKLDGMELGLSAALVEDSAQQAEAVIHALAARRAPWLPGYRVRILDGNHLSATEHRLEELRTTWAAPLPGKVLVVLMPETGLDPVRTFPDRRRGTPGSNPRHAVPGSD